MHSSFARFSDAGNFRLAGCWLCEHPRVGQAGTRAVSFNTARKLGKSVKVGGSAALHVRHCDV